MGMLKCEVIVGPKSYLLFFQNIRKKEDSFEHTQFHILQLYQCWKITYGT